MDDLLTQVALHVKRLETLQEQISELIAELRDLLADKSAAINELHDVLVNKNTDKPWREWTESEEVLIVELQLLIPKLFDEVAAVRKEITFSSPTKKHFPSGNADQIPRILKSSLAGRARDPC